ncbi:protein-disulfide reductase DsbD family protein [Hwanghaeella sp.]|uniref:protein-disulfide reductase DsbD family protein n=1 Tax=Hwanghaeella sp. TaxID=2605943 RepID=UPI003CCBEC9C
MKTSSFLSKYVICAVAALVCALVAGASVPAHAITGAWSDTEHSSVRLVSSVTGTGEEGTLTLGLEFQMQDGWKIYWRSPGDAGFPPKPDWTGSTNVASVEMSWPAPHRFEIFGLQTYGYSGEVIFPLRVKAETPGEAISLTGKVDYLVCSDICIPGEAQVSVDVPAGPAQPSAKVHAIGQYAALVPGAPEAAGLTVDRAAVSGNPDDLTLQVDIAGPEAFVSPDIFVEGPVGVFFGKPELALSNGGKLARLTLKGAGSAPEDLARQALTLTVVDGPRSAETTVSPSVGTGPAAGGAVSVAGLLPILLLAVLGGLILNLMPCVLPVLSIKLLSVASHGGGEKRHVRRGFVAASLGILTMFLALAVVLVGLKSAGETIGWGIQFQQPAFLAFMIVILTLFAANMWGLFEISLPRFVADTGYSAGEQKGVLGHFLTGAFAALLATPCSAPFLGTAVGFALSRGSVEILTVFAALGLGLAGPYLMVAAFPGLATALPRPGPWMIKLKWVLGVALAGTALWLAYVMSAITGMETVAVVLALAVLAAVIPATKRVEGSRLGRMALPLSVFLGVAAVVAPIVRDGAPPIQAPSIDVGWVPFSQAEIARHVSEGKVVFVDVTADWCITCQFNKKRVLQAGEVASLLGAPGMVAMRADWTRPNADIASYLAAFGRYGIPFNVVYGPGAEQGIPLPELLTETAVLEAVDTAAQGSVLARR